MCVKAGRRGNQWVAVCARSRSSRFTSATRDGGKGRPRSRRRRKTYASISTGSARAAESRSASSEYGSARRAPAWPKAKLLPHRATTSVPKRTPAAFPAETRDGFMTNFLDPVFGSLCFIHGRVGQPHFIRSLHRAPDLDQFAFPDARAPASGPLPFPAGLQQFGPERKQTALGRLCRMNPAAAVAEEMALRFGRFPQPQQMARAIHISRLELGRRHIEKLRRPAKVLFGQINKALLIATRRASRLAGEPQIVHDPSVTQVRPAILC